jgi:hypothetical protein
MTRVTALVVCGDEAPQAQGFINRDRLMLEALAVDHDVCVVGVAARTQDLLDFVDRSVVDASLLGRPSGVFARLWRLASLRAGLLSRPERRLRDVIADTRPDVILVLTLWNAELVRCARSVAPTAFFAEERLGRSRVTGPGAVVSLSILLRRAELASASGLPAVAVLRSEDVGWAAERFSSPVVVVPHGIDVPYWEAAVPPRDDAGPLDVVSVANHTVERTALPLAEIIDQLEGRGWPEGLRLRLVSAAGYHPCLVERQGQRVELLGAVDDPRPLYRSAVATLVPAFEANGVKNGIIQGWVIGCPVVTTPASAATVQGRDEVDLLVGEDPAGVAAILAGLPGREDLGDLASTGRRHLDERFGASAHDAAVRGLVASLAGS